jgi:hypothetical protein
MGNAFILIVIGLLLMYAVVSDKFYCLEGCFNCLRAPKGTTGAAAGAGADLSRPVQSRGAVGAGAGIGPFANFF